MKNEVREYTRNVEMSGAFRPTLEGELHWRSEKVENSPRLHIRAINYRGGIRWFAGIEMFGELETVYIQQTSEEGCETLTDAVNSARERLRAISTTLSVYSSWF